MLHRIFQTFIFSLLTLAMFGQDVLPNPKLIDRSYRDEYRETLKREQRVVKEVSQEWDYWIDLPERVPTFVTDNIGAADFTNWGKTFMLPAALEQRVFAECTHRVVLKTCDTGDSDHPDLQQNKRTAANYTTETTAKDGHGHSTHVESIARGDGGGLAYQMVRNNALEGKACKVLGTQGQGSFTWLQNCVGTEYNEDKVLKAQGIRVVYNMSLGGGTQKQPGVESALAAGVALGNVYVTAAGNTGGAVQYPGNSDYTLTVSAIQQNSTIAGFSCRGPEITVAAPGVGIRAAYKGGTYADLSGTSMAAPFISAAVCIAIGKWGDLLPNQNVIRDYFSWVGTDIGSTGKDDLYGWGIIFVQRILDMNPSAMPGNPGPPPPPPADPVVQNYNIIGGSFLFRWRVQGAAEWQVLKISRLEYSASVKAASGPAGYDVVTKAVADYYSRWATELTPAMDYRDATYWAGQFLEYITRDAGTPVQVTRLDAQDEAGRVHVVTAFERAEDAKGRGTESEAVPYLYDFWQDRSDAQGWFTPWPYLPHLAPAPMPDTKPYRVGEVIPAPMPMGGIWSDNPYINTTPIGPVVHTPVIISKNPDIQTADLRNYRFRPISWVVDGNGHFTIVQTPVILEGQEVLPDK